MRFETVQEWIDAMHAAGFQWDDAGNLTQAPNMTDRVSTPWPEFRRPEGDSLVDNGEMTWQLRRILGQERDDGERERPPLSEGAGSRGQADEVTRGSDVND